MATDIVTIIFGALLIAFIFSTISVLLQLLWLVFKHQLDLECYRVESEDGNITSAQPVWSSDSVIPITSFIVSLLYRGVLKCQTERQKTTEGSEDEMAELEEPVEAPDYLMTDNTGLAVTAKHLGRSIAILYMYGGLSSAIVSGILGFVLWRAFQNLGLSLDICNTVGSTAFILAGACAVLSLLAELVCLLFSRSMRKEQARGMAFNVVISAISAYCGLRRMPVETVNWMSGVCIRLCNRYLGDGILDVLDQYMPDWFDSDDIPPSTGMDIVYGLCVAVEKTEEYKEAEETDKKDVSLLKGYLEKEGFRFD